MKEPAYERGPYLTGNRVHELERDLGRLEGRLVERIDKLERDLAALRATEIDALRAQAGALLEVLRDRLGAQAADHPPKEESGP